MLREFQSKEAASDRRLSANQTLVDREPSVVHHGTTRYLLGKLLGWCDVEVNPDIKKETMKYISVDQIEKNFCTINLYYRCGRNVSSVLAFLVNNSLLAVFTLAAELFLP